MNTPDEMEEQLKAFHTYLTALHKLHLRNLALRYLASLQPEAMYTLKPPKPRRVRLVWSRRFLSRQLRALAQVIDPDKARQSEPGDREHTDQVIDVQPTTYESL